MVDIDAAFTGCTSLTELIIPASVTSIGSYAFDGCVNLSRITFAGTVEQWQAIHKWENWAAGSGIAEVYSIASDSYADISSAWSAFGSIYGSNWKIDFAMERIHDAIWETEILELKAGEEFIVRQNASWSFCYGMRGEVGGEGICVDTDGSYRIRLTIHGEKAMVELIPVE